MKKLILLLLFGMAACSQQNARTNIQRTFPDSLVETVPDTKYAYLVLEKSGKLWYVYDDGQLSNNTIPSNNYFRLFASRTIMSEHFQNVEKE